MAGSVTDPRIGVGLALRRAREVREVSLDEAARDTRVRIEQLDALEREDFDVMPGDVYVRASLRTYANYLGLDADELADAYARNVETPEPVRPPAKLGPVERMIAASRIRDNQRFLLVSALSILVILLAFGVLTRGAAAPPAAEVPTETASPLPPEPRITAVLTGNGDVGVRAVIDGRPRSFTLRPDETVSLEAFEKLRISVEDAGLVEVSVGGREQTTGTPGLPHTYVFALGDDAGGTSSSSG